MSTPHDPSEASARDAASLAAEVRRASPKGPPPVHLWNPPYCGDLDIRIARDGTWFYLGTPINRPELVRLFASVLRRDGDAYFLVTPVEKIGIRVDDAPFVAVDFEQDGDTLIFQTNVGDRVRAGAEHPIRVSADPETGEPAPYIHVRRGLEASIDRKSFYRLAEMSFPADTAEGPRMVVRAGGETFPIGPTV